ncbi:MAG: aldo/keto reductase, partial [Deltaproteobacteria bacterium]|nr:aldo/keto reductase [Deltaproteobacteria bacterium]
MGKGPFQPGQGCLFGVRASKKIISNQFILEENTMYRMKIGNTGIEVSRLALGTIPLQRIAEKEAIDVVSYAIQKGIDFIDTARNYTVSESRIGKAVEESGKKVVLSSKSAMRTSDGIRKEIEKSMKELKVSHIEFYHCHAVGSDEDYRRIIAKDGALNGLLKAKEEGLTGHTGISSYNVEVMDKIISDNLFETIMVGFNIVEPIAYKSVIPKAVEKNSGIFIMKPLAGGVTGIPGLALRWALSFPGMIIITGME